MKNHTVAVKITGNSRGRARYWRRALLCLLFLSAFLSSCKLLGEISEYNLPQATEQISAEEGKMKEAVPPSDFQKKEIALLASTLQNLNPYALQNASVDMLLKQCYQGLMTLSAKGEIVAQLAEAVVLSEDTMSCDVTIGGRLFHDGAPVRFQDISYSWQKAKEGRYAAEVIPIQKMVSLGEDRLRIHFQTPGILNLYSLTFPIVKENSLEKGDPYSINGTGPYRLAEYKPMQVLRLQSEGNQLEITLSRSESAAQEAFLNGRTDLYFASHFPWFDFSEETLRNIAKFPGKYFYFMGFKGGGGWTADGNIRQYLLNKLDREMLFKNAFLNHILVQRLPFYRGKEWEAELEEAPAVEGMNVLDKNPIVPGQKLILLYPQEDPSLRLMAETLKLEWEAYVGMELAGLAAKEYELALQEGRFDVYLAKLPVRQYPDLKELLGSGGKYNYSGAAMEALISSFMQARTEEELKKAYLTLAAKVNEEKWIIPFGFAENAVILSDQVSGLLTPKTHDALFGINELKPVKP